MKKVVCCFLLYLLYSATQDIRGQTVPVSPSPLVTVTAATPDKLPGLDPDIVGQFHPNTFLLTNESNRNIIGLMIRWTYTSAQGLASTNSVSTDSLDRANAALLAPNATLIVAPNAFLPVAYATLPHTGPMLADLNSQGDPAMVGATNIQASIDLIIWQDGEIVGPNQTNFDEELHNRKLAAAALASQVRSTIANGGDPKVLVQQIAAIKPQKHDTFAYHTHIFARLVLNAPDVTTIVQWLEALPEPPKFFRKGEAQCST